MSGRKLRTNISVLLLTTLALSPAALTQEEGQGTKLHIEVTSAESGQPLAHATVRVKSKVKAFEKDLKTGSDGSVTFTDVPRGKILVQVLLSGWDNFGKQYDLEQKEETVSIEMTPAAGAADKSKKSDKKKEDKKKDDKKDEKKTPEAPPPA